MAAIIATATTEILTTTSAISPSAAPFIMHALSSLLLLGGAAVQHVLARPGVPSPEFDAAILKRSVDDFVAKEEPIALSELLCNIGASGCYAQGVAAGAVIASVSRSDPDCMSNDHP